MVLCAGLGTRLRPLTDRLPKPALPILDSPLVRRHFRLARDLGADDIAVNIHHLPETMRRCAEREAAALGLPLRVSHEIEIQGTAGGIRDAMRGRGHELVVVLNGDTLFDVDLASAIRAHRRAGAVATMVLAPMPKSEAYAAVEADRSLRVRRIAGTGPAGRDLRPWHFTGVHVLGSRFFEFAPGSGPCDINRDVYPTMIDQGLTVAGHVDRGYWSDVGTPDRLLRLHRDFLRRRIPEGCTLAAEPGVHESARVHASVTIGGRVYVGPEARIAAGAVLGPDAFVGAGATVGEHARVKNAVVMAGATIAAEEVIEGSLAYEDLRITPNGTGRARR